ncbi:MAG: DNA polymerase Y family protein [Lautropia sp.]
MLWLGLHFPQLPLELFEPGQRLLAKASGTAELPFAICNRAIVEQVNPAARARGIEVGHQRATALAIAADLILQDRDLAAELDALQRLAGWALQFTPRLSLQPPIAERTGAGLLLEIGPSLRLFGGLAALTKRMRQDLTALGFTAAIAVAPTATAASLFARWRDGLIVSSPAELTARLDRLPLALLDSLCSQPEAVTAIGARAFADLTGLPRAGLARRFGAALLREMDLALGRQPEVRPWYQAPSRFSATLELLADVEQAEALLLAAWRPLHELAGWLAARQAAVRHFVLVARHDRGRRNRDAIPAATRIEVGFASPTRDVARMHAVLRERLAVTPLPAATHTLELNCDDIVAAGSPSGTLLPGAAAPEENLDRLIERLQARLGRHQIQRIHLAADHRPEAAYRIEPIDKLPSPLPASPRRSASSRSAASPAAAQAALLSPSLAETLRPLWLLAKPLPLHERDRQPWWRGPLTLLGGPERIESGWWDGHLVQRDYFIAEDAQAHWLWIYRARGRSVADDHAAESGWYLQGLFG